MCVITHNDLDGIVSAYFIRQFAINDTESPSVPEVITVSYKDDRDKMFKSLLDDRIIKRGMKTAPKGPVYFTDLSLTPGELEWARGKKKSSKWYWFDHHLSSLEFDPEGIFDEVFLDTEGEHCAADIVYDWLTYEQGYDSEQLAPLAEWRYFAHDRDLWINQARELNMKLDSVVRQAIYKGKLDSLFKVMQKGAEEVLQRFRSEWEYMEKRYHKSVELAANTSAYYPHINTEYPIVVAYVSGNSSDVADTLYRSNTDIIAMIDIIPPNVILSLRSKRDDVDLSKVAKAFNGGGHLHAAGGKLDGDNLVGGYQHIVEKIWSILEE